MNPLDAMDARQMVYLVALCVVTVLAWGRVVGVIWVNACITLAALAGADLEAYSHHVAMVYGAWGDLACGVVLIAMGWRVLGYLYLPVAIWTILGFTIGFTSYITYTFAYVIGYIQLAVVWVGHGRDGYGGGGGCGRNGGVFDGGRFFDCGNHSAMGADGMAQAMGKDSRG